MNVQTTETTTWSRDAFRHAGIGMAVLGLDGTYLQVNDALCLQLDTSVRDLLGTSPADTVHPGDRQQLVDALGLLISGATDAWRRDLRHVRPDRTVVHLAGHARLVRDDEGRPAAMHYETIDVTDRLARAAGMVELGRQAMSGASLDELRLAACALVVEVVGVDPDLVAQVLSGRTPVPADLLAEDRDFVFSALQVLDSATARARAEHESWHLTMHDSLTGLANRTLFAERMSDALVELRPGRDHISLISLDVDGFKRVNDSLGHMKGDELLRDVAQRITDAVRPSDTVARLGGDEFAILLTTLAHPSEADTVAARVLTALQAPFTVSGHAVHLSASIGITSAASRAVNPDELLADADLAMYAAKAAGKGRAVCFSPNLRKAAVGQLALEEDLRYASTRGLFRLDYQPVVELETGRFIGGEALIRWPHPTRGLVAPLDFIPLAEDTGLVVPLGAWVLEQACAQLAQWHPLVPSDAEFSVGINVSARQIVEPGFADAVRATLARADVDPRRIVLEMTESVFIADDVESMRILTGLREMGIRIAIDDFGTGYSSLAYLRRVPLDILKVDRSFVTNLASNRQDRAITGAVVELARQLDLFVIAEGIETAEQLESLVDLGCTAGQGYLMHRPMDPDAFTAALMDRLPLGGASDSATT